MNDNEIISINFNTKRGYVEVPEYYQYEVEESIVYDNILYFNQFVWGALM